MSQSDKSAYFRALKAAGVKFDKHYREYTTDELAAAYTKLVQGQEQADAPPVPPPAQHAPPPRQVARREPAVPVAPRNPNEMPGQRLNESEGLQPIRTDERGRVWYQEEVLKPAYPKPRGRRVLDYIETGSKTVEAKNGEYVESFEVAGDEAPRAAQVKITLPSFQVGIYKDPRFPFKIYCYNGNEGFDFFEVNRYYGGVELVPAEIKRKYVENALCYDIRSVVAAIQKEYRQLQLQGKV